MSDQSWMLMQENLVITRNAISLQESVGGQEHLSSQGGTQADLFGPEVLHAKASQSLEKVKEKTIADTSGLSSLISSESAILQQSLVNKLQQLLDMGGLTIYKATLKQKATPQQRVYCHLGLSGHRTKGTDSSSQQSAWATPVAQPANGSWEQFLERKRKSVERGHSLGISLTDTQMQAKSIDVSAWPTPILSDMKDRGKWDDQAVQRRIRIGKQVPLSSLVQTTSPWPTPTHHNAKEGGYAGEIKRNTIPLGAMKHIVAWPTPQAMDSARGPIRSLQNGQRIDKKGQRFGLSLVTAATLASGQIPQSSTVETESTVPSQLNPRFSLWLMGYPIEWAYSGEQVTRLSHKRQQK